MSQSISATSFRLSYEAYKGIEFAFVDGSSYDIESKPLIFTPKLFFDTAFNEMEFNYSADIYRVQYDLKEEKLLDTHYWQSVRLSSPLRLEKDTLAFPNAINLERLFLGESSPFFDSQGIKIIIYASEKFKIRTKDLSPFFYEEIIIYYPI